MVCFLLFGLLTFCKINRRFLEMWIVLLQESGEGILLLDSIIGDIGLLCMMDAGEDRSNLGLRWSLHYSS